jgi:hypothetical protein
MANQTPQHPRLDVPNAHELMPRRFKDYIVSERELSSLGFLSAFGGLMITLFGVAAGALIALKITLNTVPIPDVQTHANYFAAYLISVGFTVICGAAAAISVGKTFFEVRRIRKDSEQEQRRRDLAEAENVGETTYSSYGMRLKPKPKL